MSTPSWPLLHAGNKGNNISALQCLLIYNGYSVTVDGSFGPQTKTAVESFQASNGIPSDGIVTASTYTALITTVQYGDKNYAAKAAQYLLAKFEVIVVDGSFGPNSRTITTTFQQKIAITVSATINALTWQYLFGYNVYPGYSSSTYASVCVYPSTLTTTQKNVNVNYIYAFLRNQGYTKQAACAVLGNMQQESNFNPGIWQVLNTLTSGYGLVQWTGATKYLNRAVSTGLIMTADSTSINAITTSNAQRLMDSELAFLIYSCVSGGEFFIPTAGGSMDHSGHYMTYAQFISSTLDAGTLAVVFHDHYERSRDTITVINQRASYALAWYNSL